ncbi:MAG TPA: penicillin-binding transpeptidase domain-containing protein [Solirubrobacter sp.]
MIVVGLVVAAAAIYGAYALISSQLHEDRRHEAVEKFTAAWVKSDYKTMYGLLDVTSRRQNPQISFLADYRRANKAAGVQKITLGKLGPLLSGGNVKVPVTVKTKDFGSLKGTLTFHATQANDIARVGWTPELVMPGLRKGEEVRRRSGAAPRRGVIYAAGGQLLNSDPLGASISGTAGNKPTGLERIYDDRLGGRRSSSLKFGDRTVAKIAGRKGRSIHTTIKLALTRTAQNALGSKLGGIAVIKPSDGSVLALAGLAVSAPQPPGSSFKIITAAAALQDGVAKISSSYPVRQYATLSGVKLRNASDEQCGGSLTSSFAHSCNSVFGPIGAKLGAKKLVAAAERFGFNETPSLPAAKPNSIPKAADLKDSLAVGASAIGQNKDLATPLGMASVGATIANGGVRIKPWVTGPRPPRKRAVSAKVAAQVRDMMIAVVQGGTGAAAAIPGVTVAGKTGTAELVSTADIAQNAKNTTAWFVAFAPANKPRVAVAVMLPGAGQGGASAAPLAKRVLQAAL